MSNSSGSNPTFGRWSFYSLRARAHTHTHTHTQPSQPSLFVHFHPPFPADFGPWVLPSPLPGTHRVCVLGGKLGMRWISLQVTLKSSSWWHLQGGEGHPFPLRLLGRTRSSASCSRGVGLIVLGAPRLCLHPPLSPHSQPSAPRVPSG